MDPVELVCAECDATIGTLVNLWTKIGKRYLAPVTARDDDLKITLFGPVRPGLEDTVVAGCMLRDADCSSCEAYLGQSCVKSPQNHTLQEGQMILRNSSIHLRSPSDPEQAVEPVIKRSLKLKLDSSSASNSDGQGAASSTPGSGEDFNLWRSSQSDNSTGDDVDVSQLQADLEAQREELKNMSATGYQAVSTFEGAMSRMDQKVQQLNDLIESVRKSSDGQKSDIDTVREQLGSLEKDKVDLTALARLEERLQATNATVDEARKAMDEMSAELRDSLEKTHQTSMGTKHDVDALKLEQARLEDAVSLDRQTTQEVARTMSFLRNEMDRELAGTKERFQLSSERVDDLEESLERIEQATEELRSTGEVLRQAAEEDRLITQSQAGAMEELRDKVDTELASIKEAVAQAAHQLVDLNDTLLQESENTAQLISSTTDFRNQTNEQVAEIKAEREELNQQVQEFKDTTNEQLEELKAATKKGRDSTKQIQDYITDLREAMEGQLSSLEQENNNLRGQLQEARETYAAARSASEDTAAHVHALQSELDQLRSEMSARTASETSSLRQELKQLKQEMSKQSSGDILTLKREMKHLQGEFLKEQQNMWTYDNILILYEELDILSRSVSKTNNRANQIESLQMDVELFRTRLQRIEGVARSKKSVGSVKLIGDAGKGDELSQPSSEPTRQKRALPDTDNSEFLGATPPKKRMTVSDESSGGSRSTNSMSASSPTLLIGAKRPVRRINFGAITGKAAKQGA